MDVSVLYKSAALDLGIQWVCWAVAVAFSTEKFFDLAGSATYALLAYLSLQWGGGHFTRQKVQATSTLVLMWASWVYLPVPASAERMGVPYVVQTTLVLIWAVRLGSYLFLRVQTTLVLIWAVRLGSYLFLRVQTTLVLIWAVRLGSYLFLRVQTTLVLIWAVRLGSYLFLRVQTTLVLIWAVRLGSYLFLRVQTTLVLIWAVRLGSYLFLRVQTTLVLIWALRLGSYLFLRVLRDGKDVRFDEAKRNPVHFLVFWTLQAVWVFITLLPTLILNAKTRDRSLGFQDYLGWTIWTVGLLLEAVADYQKSVFKADPENSGKFIQSGLWSISQHPNYLGEISLWLGLYITAAGVMSGWEHISVVSPVFVAFLLLKVSGVPLLDELGMKRWGNNPAYVAYRQRTAVLVPFVW
ncbi:hypothetical protein Bbelb_261150 [Branchiostoma belcheri]|nr:hypothetical protein Bbelb_261150 [Branchiostoma belcheri]